MFYIETRSKKERLMVTHSGNPDLQRNVAEAVREAAATGRPISRAQIVARFHNRGAARATLFRWVDEAVHAQVAKTVGARRVGMPIGDVVEALANNAGADPQPNRTKIDDDKAIPFVQICRDALRKLDLLADMMYGSDGSIHRPFALLKVIEAHGKWIMRAYKIDAAWRDKRMQFEAERKFMKAIVNCVMVEPPEIRTRILARMRALEQDPAFLKE